MSDDLRNRVAQAVAAYDDHRDIASQQEPDATSEYIAALEAQNRELALQVIASDGQAMEAYEAQKAADAKLAVAVDALRVLANEDGLPIERYRRAAEMAQRVARTTLEQIGESHE